ncbi:mitochondrial protein Pet127-domain-containing protein [Lophiotrema nucula]|uniref:Mitochondrial protein Pet127-domain-containing protein n=1 Tax=Lophiotrema nucula TaxID=690887 RepID=A0A6A5Z9H3_9PLEO|nr:mitochondrial protein Pet127-domain-containing protein [Lophiotrema nucula]
MQGSSLEAAAQDKTKKTKKKRASKKADAENLPVEILTPEQLDFQPINVEIPPVPMLAHGLDRVLFNPGVYRLQDPRSRVYNFDPYLEKIMPVREFDFEALNEYKTSSKDETLLDMTKNLGVKFTGSTSSMTGVLSHFHYLLSNWRPLNNNALSHEFPAPLGSFSKTQRGPSAIFLRYKDGIYAIDADKSYDTPNIMSWLGHSLEKLLTHRHEDFERYRRSSPDKPPSEDKTGNCFHYTQLGNILMRSQLDAHDPRLPGTGVFDLKTRAVVSIRMNAQDYETGVGYQLRYGTGEWESYEREFHDMTRSTLLKYSLQVRMGRMDGIFVAYHNIERIFGFQYVSVPDMDAVLHGQTDTTLGDQEFKLSVRLLDELLERATQKFPESSIRLHFETREAQVPFMYVFAEPVTEEEADSLQDAKLAAKMAFERNTIGVNRDDPEVQEAWQDMQEQVDEEISEEGEGRAKEVTSEEESEEGERNAEEAAGEDTDQAHVEDSVSSSADSNVEGEVPEAQSAANGDLPEGKRIAGWTLTVRNRVNGAYVPRPTNLRANDDWSLEYLIQDIDDDIKVKRLHGQLQDRRHKLLGKTEEEQATDLARMRDILGKYSRRGRAWREEQDKIDAQVGKRVYRPLGPGADEALSESVSSEEEATSGPGKHHEIVADL